jgi:hypothetical protein
MQGKARLRGLYRIIYSKTISPRLYKAKPACAGSTGSFLQRPQALGDGRRSPPAQARAEELFNDHHFVHPSPAQTHAEIMEIEHLIRYAPRAVGLKPSAMEGEARLRGRERRNYSTTIISAYLSCAYAEINVGALCDDALLRPYGPSRL